MKNTIELYQAKITNALSLERKADCAMLEDVNGWHNCKEGQY